MVDNHWLYINWNMFRYFKTVVVILKFISSLVVLRNYGKIIYNQVVQNIEADHVLSIINAHLQ